MSTPGRFPVVASSYARDPSKVCPPCWYSTDFVWIAMAAPYTLRMQRREGLEGLRSISPGSVLSVGNFDGMHRGHRRLLELASSLRTQSSGKIAVVTFEPHPLTVLRPELAPPRLTPPAVKQKLLQEAGVDEYVVLPPSQDVLNLTAEAFWAILRDEVQPAHMIEGSSFN